MQHEQNLFNDLARKALSAYELKDCSLVFVQHSDNVTFKVQTPDPAAYLLRLHVPITGAMGAHGARQTAVNSELLWLEALSRDTDLTLQIPVRNRAGELVTRLADEPSGSNIHCTLLHWLEGEPYLRDMQTIQTAQQIGEILASLHNHASAWTIPKDFDRPRRDALYFQRALKGILPALRDGRISASDHAEFEQSIRRLTEMLYKMEESRQVNGLLHGDAHKGNMIFHDGDIRFIDFSFCSHGNFMFDLGVCLSDMDESLHPVCLAGYQKLRPLPEGHQSLIEGFFIGSMVGTFSYWVENRKAQQRLITKVPEIARGYAAMFNQGEHFWFG
jgi:Ser/Thr protein kinase RdoA (MazF antagonist)